MSAELVEIRGVPEWWLPGLAAPRAERDPENFAHGVWTAVAATLAEPLRKAFGDHADSHGCGRPGGGGMAYCPEAMRLFALLPEGDRVVTG